MKKNIFLIFLLWFGINCGGSLEGTEGGNIPEISPLVLSAKALSPNQVSLEWKIFGFQSNLFALFYVERKNPEDSEFQVLTVLDSSLFFYEDSSLQEGSQYIYRIRGIQGEAGKTLFSSEVSILTGVSLKIGAPQNLVVNNLQVYTDNRFETGDLMIQSSQKEEPTNKYPQMICEFDLVWEAPVGLGEKKLKYKVNKYKMENEKKNLWSTHENNFTVLHFLEKYPSSFDTQSFILSVTPFMDETIGETAEIEVMCHTER